MTNATSLSDDAMMELARTIAGGDCTLAWHEGVHGGRAIRISGCDPDAARRIGMAIQGALFGPADRDTGLLPVDYWRCGFASQAGFAAVWVR